MTKCGNSRPRSFRRCRNLFTEAPARIYHLQPNAIAYAQIARAQIYLAMGHLGEARMGDDWLHEIKYDGYRMHARIDGGQVKLRTGLDWSHRYRRTIEALRSHVLPAG
jgi:ATP-dependent DNA ligase